MTGHWKALPIAITMALVASCGGNSDNSNTANGGTQTAGAGGVTASDARLTVSVVGQNTGGGQVASVPLGLECDNTKTQCTKDFAKGTKVSLVAVPDEISQLTAWGGACAGTTGLTCELGELQTNQTVVATFAQRSDKLTVSLVGSAVQGASVRSKSDDINCPEGACSGDFPAGKVLTLVAQPAPGTVFTGWYGIKDCTPVGPTASEPNAPIVSNECTFKVGRAQPKIEASFSQMPSIGQQAVQTAGSCDVTVNEHCLYPFPNNHFTVADGGPTGVKVNLDPLQMPRNAAGVPISPLEWNRHDGFSVGAKLVTYFKGVDYPELIASHAPLLTNLAKSLSPDSNMVLLDADTLEPQLIWAEPERSKAVEEHDALGVTDATRTLTLRVAKNLEYGKRYIVGIRAMRDAQGNLQEAAPEFRVFRDQVPSGQAAIEVRRTEMEDIFQRLSQAGVPRYQLVQAWDFTTISQENLTERVLHMRDTVYDQIAAGNYNFDIQIGDVAGQDPITAISLAEEVGALFSSGLPETFAGEGAGFQTRLQNLVTKLSNMDEPSAQSTDPDDHYRSFRTINGSFSVPCFLNTPNCAPAGGLVYQPDASGIYGDGLPDGIPGSTMRATFTCRIPKSVFENGTDAAGKIVYDFTEVKHPARASMYGHGLLGSRGEVNNGSHVAWASREGNIMYCALNWTGFATEDVPSAVAGLLDMNNFPRFIDRQLQGMLNWLVLQEALVAAPGKGGFMDIAAFQDSKGKSLYKLDFEANKTQGGLFYDGNSQGGIMGGALVALSPRICHAVLGVPGMNYSTLLRRSKDFQANKTVEQTVQATVQDSIAEQSPPEPEIGYSQPFDTSYSNPLDQAFIMSLIQMVWDRGETNGFAQFLGAGQALRSHPITGAQPGQAQCDKQVLLHVAFGDHQVSMTTAEVLARTAGMPRVANAPGEGRHPDGENAYFQIDTIPAGGMHTGSAFIAWDSGPEEVAAPPVENTPPRLQNDPHEHPRRAVEAREQKMRYLRSGGSIPTLCGQSAFSFTQQTYCFSGEAERQPLPVDKLADIDTLRNSLER